MLTVNRIVAVGSKGTVLRTTNAGKTWSVKNGVGGVRDYLLGVCFTDSMNGTVVGTKGTILHTTDGGENWLRQISGTDYALYDVWFTNSAVGTAVGLNGTILRTTDGGGSWKLFSIPFFLHLYSVCFIDSNKGVAVGEPATIVYTSDGGNNWSVQASGMTDYLADVCFVDEKTGFAVGVGIVLKTTDGGLTWNTQVSGLNSDLQDVAFFDSLHGIIVGDPGVIYQTSDGGNSWNKASGEIGGGLNGISLVGDSLAYCAGYGGEILCTTDRGVTWADVHNGTVANLTGISFRDHMTGFAVGQSGMMMHTSSGGLSWSQVTTGTSQDLHAVVSVSPQAGFAVGDSGIIIKSTDGGDSWEYSNIDNTNRLFDIYFINDDTGFVVGSTTIRCTTDGGDTWSSPNADQSYIYRGIAFEGNQTGLVVGEYGIILRSTDKGQNWAKLFENREIDLYDIASAGDRTWIACGYRWQGERGGTVGRTTDNGDTWNWQKLDAALTPFSMLYGVSFIDSIFGTVVGVEGTIFVTTNRGISWRNVESPTFNILRSVSVVKYFDGFLTYAVGDGGAVLVSAGAPLHPKTWTWVGIQDSSWHKSYNWSPAGVPLPGDSVIIPPALHSPVIDSLQQQILIASLNILEGGRLTITGALPRFVVLGDVIIQGTLEVRPPAATTIIVGGNRTIRTGGGRLQPVRDCLADYGFIPYHSTVVFSGSGTVAGNFYDVMFDTASGMTSLGNIFIQNQGTVIGDVKLQNADTVLVQGLFAQALIGPGKFIRGTISRYIQESALEPYSFESQSSFLRFDGSGTYPTRVAITTYPDTNPASFGNKWILVPSRVDTSTNTIVADSVKDFSRWAFGIPRPTGSEEGLLARDILDTMLLVGRVYLIQAEGGDGFSSQVSLHYEQSEVPPGLREDSLKLLRLEEPVGLQDLRGEKLPADYTLIQNFPNPFNPSTTISYELPNISVVTLKIINVLGQVVSLLENGVQQAGYRQVRWNAGSMTSGVYFYRLEATSVSNPSQTFIQVKKLIYLK